MKIEITNIRFFKLQDAITRENINSIFSIKNLISAFSTTSSWAMHVTKTQKIYRLDDCIAKKRFEAYDKRKPYNYSSQTLRKNWFVIFKTCMGGYSLDLFLHSCQNQKVLDILRCKKKLSVDTRYNINMEHSEGATFSLYMIYQLVPVTTIWKNTERSFTKGPFYACVCAIVLRVFYLDFANKLTEKYAGYDILVGAPDKKVELEENLKFLQERLKEDFGHWKILHIQCKWDFRWKKYEGFLSDCTVFNSKILVNNSSTTIEKWDIPCNGLEPIMSKNSGFWYVINRNNAVLKTTGIGSVLEIKNVLKKDRKYFYPYLLKLKEIILQQLKRYSFIQVTIVFVNKNLVESQFSYSFKCQDHNWQNPVKLNFDSGDFYSQIANLFYFDLYPELQLKSYYFSITNSLDGLDF